MSRQDSQQFISFVLKHKKPLLKEKYMQSDLSEDYKEVLDRKLLQVRRNDIITVIHYHQGEYLKTTGMVSKIYYNSRYIKVVNTKIYFDDLYDIVLQ